MKLIGYKSTKVAIGAVISILIAGQLGLLYSTACGIITILSIQNTKRKSILIAIRRMTAFLIAFFIAIPLFLIVGFNTFVFGLYLLVFIPIAIKIKVEEGIVVSSVLVTHILVEGTVTPSLLFNESLLMVIGVSIALLLNIYMPTFEEELSSYQDLIERKIQEILLDMSTSLKQHYVSIKEETYFNELQDIIKKAKEVAINNRNNYLFSGDRYYEHYMDMREQQFEILKRMRSHFKHFYMTVNQTIMIAEFTDKVANSYFTNYSTEALLKGINSMRGMFKRMELPKTREEFENRAMLYQFLNDMEQFLKLKVKFKVRQINKYKPTSS
ncbi:aromatic acid exporter family protein [Haloplasma contractile]|uniref:Membrane protein n=1 Tax=Haloplasma contractile SSD-17B TaxID=1033810 RepID=U2EFY5_9MOLU|nr:aromatic acid exporter family protein [Haloplasma contractile]ERJ13526.1 Putative membrane protein [Haloplasma contractile SSD-17B]